MNLRHYEQPELWDADRYLKDDREQNRFRITAQLVPERVTSILDVGTGNGAFLKYLEDFGVRQFKLVGLEAAMMPIRLKVCWSQICRGSITGAPFSDRSFDLVSALEVFEHLPYGDFELGLKELQRIAGRYILISVPYRERRIRVRCPYCGCVYNPEYHVRSFSGDTLAHLFEKFELTRRVFIRQSYSPGLRFLSQFLPEVLRPSFSVKKYPQIPCPQCGFSVSNALTAPVVNSTERPSGVQKSKASKTWAFWKHLLPSVKRIYWSIILYTRKD